MKQIIVIRKDLKMRRGKEIAQGAHASMAVVLDNLKNQNVKEWLSGKFTKVVVRVESEEELLKVYNDAKKAGLIASLIQDAGRTEFNNVPTYTTVAIGPAPAEDLEPVTGHLKLY